jgi:hypothetical protein
VISEFDDKGKIFTNIITKRPIRVIVQTETFRIHGQMHITPGERLKDELNASDQFVAITDASIFDGAGNINYRCSFLTLNRKYIVWIIPEEEIIKE